MNTETRARLEQQKCRLSEMTMAEARAEHSENAVTFVPDSSAVEECCYHGRQNMLHLHSLGEPL